MSYQRIYPSFDDDNTQGRQLQLQLDYPRYSSWEEQDEVEVLRDRNKVLKQYVEQANRIIEDLKRVNAKQRASLRQMKKHRAPSTKTILKRNITRELFLGCLIGLFFFSLMKALGI